jgi:hypothetical protein
MTHVLGYHERGMVCNMNESILTSIKKLLGITEEYKHFDADIIMHINSVLMILMQLGIGPTDGFSISDDSAVWSDFLSDATWLEHVKSYVYMKVKLIFDPPQSGTVIGSMEKLISEFEWRCQEEQDFRNG